MTFMNPVPNVSFLPVAVASALLFGGCANMNGPGSKSTYYAANSADVGAAWVQELGASRAATTVELPGTNVLRLRSVSAGDAYTAASGRECRKLSSTESQTLMRLICRQGDDVWYLTRSLNALMENEIQPVAHQVLSSENSAGQPAEGVMVLASTDEPKIGGALPVKTSTGNRTFAMEPGETLWSFTERVTGNPLQWEEIAEHNGIAQAASLKSGAVLEVPASLLDPG